MFKKNFDFIYNFFVQSTKAQEFGPSYSGFARFLGVSVGKIQAWREGGQWPKAPDIALLHKKMGFSYEWLVTGEGEPFEKVDAALPILAPLPEVDIAALLARLEAVEKKLEGVTDDGESPRAGTRAGDVARGVQQGGI